MDKIQEIINRLALISHPEGGYYKETYRSELKNFGNLAASDNKLERNISTAIYFLITQNSFSAFHRIKSDELWHHYDGGTLKIYVLHPNGDMEIIKLGKKISEGEKYQAVVPANTWFASIPEEGVNYVLTGCTVAPGFDFRDFELANRNDLCAKFPEHHLTIERLTR